MKSCKFIKSGLLTTVQDAGREGLAYYAIPRSGVMDQTSAELANMIVGNNIDAPLVEFNMIGAKIEFNHPAVITLTGADLGWQLNEQTIPRYRKISVNAGDLLSGGYSKQGFRAYLAIKGQVITKRSFGSAASYAPAGFGYNVGQAIKNGHLLEWQPDNSESLDFDIKGIEFKNKISIYQGPEYNLLDDVSKEALTASTFKVASDSNRMGARLQGPKMESTDIIKHSVAVLPGFIQLTPSGQLIVILQDGQTTGGYPRVAYLRQSALDNFNQLAINQPFEFILEN